MLRPLPSLVAADCQGMTTVRCTVRCTGEDVELAQHAAPPPTRSCPRTACDAPVTTNRSAQPSLAAKRIRRPPTRLEERRPVQDTYTVMYVRSSIKPRFRAAAPGRVPESPHPAAAVLRGPD